MKNVTARVVFEYDFTDMIIQMNDDRINAGEPEMTDEEIVEAVKGDLAEFDFRETVGELPVEVNIHNYRCTRCHGTNLQAPEWVYVNTNKIAGGDPFWDRRRAFCDDCDEEVDYEEVEGV